MGTKQNIAMIVLGLIISARSGLQVDDFFRQQGLDERSSAAVLRVLIPMQEHSKLNSILICNSLNDLSNDQRNCLDDIVNAGKLALRDDFDVLN